jgi:hypothetical protein
MSQQALIHGTMLPSSNTFVLAAKMFDLVSLQQTTMLYGNKKKTGNLPEFSTAVSMRGC